MLKPSAPDKKTHHIKARDAGKGAPAGQLEELVAQRDEPFLTGTWGGHLSGTLGLPAAVGGQQAWSTVQTIKCLTGMELEAQRQKREDYSRKSNSPLSSEAGWNSSNCAR